MYKHYITIKLYEIINKNILIKLFYLGIYYIIYNRFLRKGDNYMINNSIDILKENLMNLNKELGLTSEKELELNSYNDLFIKNLESNIKNVLGIEGASLEKINNISNLIDDYKENTLDKIDLNKKITSVKFDEKYGLNRDSFDLERKKISNNTDLNNMNFDKSLEDINFTTYRRKLGVTQSNNDYKNSLNNINDDYRKSLDFLYYKKETQQNEVLNEKGKSEDILNQQLSSLKSNYEEESSKIEETKIQQDSIITKNLSEQEKILFEYKINLNSQLEQTAAKYASSLTNDLIPVNNHINYLNDELELLKQNRYDEEIVFLDTFKLNLESVDKEIESYKITLNNNTDKINSSTASENTKNKEIKVLESKYKIFQEKMKRKKIEYEIDKDYKINKLNLEYDYNCDLIKKQKSFFKQQLKTVEIVSQYNENISVNQLRFEMELQELKVKYTINILKQTKSFNDMKNKLNRDFITSIYFSQLALFEKKVESTEKYYNIISNNISILTSLEIEKNLILKKYNQSLNTILNEDNSYNSSIIQKDEEFEIKLKQLKQEFINKTLSQDIQYANKKQELNKLLLGLKKEYEISKLTTEYNYQLDLKINKIFENRFKIEKNLYNIYFNAITDQNKFVLEYFSRFFAITKLKKDNILANIFSYTFEYINNNVIMLLNKIIQVVENRITFEGTVNFEYELNRLITQKEQSEILFTTSVQKMIETSENYDNTINLYNEKISSLKKESDKLNNLIIIKELEIRNSDSKNNTSIQKLQSEVIIFKENINELKNDIKSYESLITKNKKLISELNKSIGTFKIKHDKKIKDITNEIDTIEKKHKSDSGIYISFINQINTLKKDITNEIEINSDNANKILKKYSNNITNKISSFIEKNVDTLFEQLTIRHNKILAISEQKNTEIKLNEINFLNQDIKRISNSYNDDIFEIEKRVDKLYSNYKMKKKEIINNHKETIYNIKSQQKLLEYSKRKNKSTLFYNVNTFTENITTHESINSKMINDVNLYINQLEKDFMKNKDSLAEERKKKISDLHTEHKVIIKTLKQQINTTSTDTAKRYNVKKSKLDNAILQQKSLNKDVDISFRKYQTKRKIELNQEIKLLNLEYRKNINTLNKKTESKINKQQKKYK